MKPFPENVSIPFDAWYVDDGAFKTTTESRATHAHSRYVNREASEKICEANENTGFLSPRSEEVTVYGQTLRRKEFGLKAVFAGLLVKYEGNGGVLAADPAQIKQYDETAYLEGTDVAIKNNMFVKAEREFAGWNTKADGSGTWYGSVKHPQASFQIIQNTAFYAQWVIPIRGSKTWDDKNNNDGKRPASITVRLLRNGTEIARKTVTAEENWFWDFGDLPPEDRLEYEAGIKNEFTIQEEAVEDYSASYSGLNITNRYQPEEIDIHVRKIRDDDENRQGLRPQNVQIRLLADGADTGKVLDLNKENSWTGSFEKLPKMKAGAEIAYTVEEAAVPAGYEASVSGNAGSGFVITNRCFPVATNVPTCKPSQPAQTITYCPVPPETQKILPQQNLPILPRTGEAAGAHRLNLLFLILGGALLFRTRKK